MAFSEEFVGVSGDRWGGGTGDNDDGGGWQRAGVRMGFGQKN